MRARPLNPLAAEDGRLLEAVNRGEFTINGFRNRDLRGLLFPKQPSDEAERRQQSGMITRTRSSGMPNALATSPRTANGFWVAVWTVTLPSCQSATAARGSIGQCWTYATR